MAGPGAARRGRLSRRGRGGEARSGRRRRDAAAARAAARLACSLARLLARAVRVQPAALRTQAHGARSRTRPRREAPRWVLKSPDSAPPSQPGAESASLNPGAGGASPAWILLSWGTRRRSALGETPLDGRGLRETSKACAPRVRLRLQGRRLQTRPCPSKQGTFRSPSEM